LDRIDPIPKKPNYRHTCFHDDGVRREAAASSSLNVSPIVRFRRASPKNAHRLYRSKSREQEIPIDLDLVRLTLLMFTEDTRHHKTANNELRTRGILVSIVASG
jgi:hypothetical protein